MQVCLFFSLYFEDKNGFAMKQAVILLGHGSRDPLWSQPMQAMAQAITQARPDMPAVCAFLELCEPTAQQAIAQLLAADAQIEQVVVYPVFLGMGLHLREDLPEIAQSLQQQFPAVAIHFTPALGMDAQLIALVSQSVLQSCAALAEAAPNASI